MPAVGQSFELLTAGGGIVGAFDTVLLPLMPNNLEVGVLYSPSSVMMEIRIDPTSIDLPGDYNGDGEVNSADYTVWRNSLGQTGSSLAADGSGPTPGIPDGVVNQFDYSFWKRTSAIRQWLVPARPRPHRPSRRRSSCFVWRSCRCWAERDGNRLSATGCAPFVRALMNCCYSLESVTYVRRFPPILLRDS